MLIGTIPWLLAAAALFEGELEVPRGRARGIPVQVEAPTYIECRYEVKGLRSVMRAALLTAAEVKNYQEGRAHTWIVSTPYSATGQFRALAMQPGTYYVLIDNRLDLGEAVTARVEVTGTVDASLPRRAPAGRRRAVVGTSLALFALVAGWSGVRLRRAWAGNTLT